MLARYGEGNTDLTRARQTRAELIEAVCTEIARIERNSHARQDRATLAFGHANIDAHLPGGGLALGALHEVAGTGPDVEHGSAAALFAAGVLARSDGPVLWAVEHYDLFAPALAGVGLRPDRTLYAVAGPPAAVLLVMEEGLRHRGLAGVVGEVSGRLSPRSCGMRRRTASRSGRCA